MKVQGEEAYALFSKLEAMQQAEDMLGILRAQKLELESQIRAYEEILSNNTNA